ncbi:reverse transcriptase [Gossypium australe]|uniref:Reverse transcriptase n=1 Tax=Gossypium australe TaxID=47621 RepID=A0A5B6WC07_9ROSI|nr:reverse transcriptase [Gossypium australe]
MVGQRHSRGRVSKLVDDNGVRHSEPANMLKVASDYFADLFTTSEMGLDKHLLNLMERKVTDDMNESLLQRFMEEDVWNAVKSMPSLKAPGVDDFLAIFFQRYWHIVGPEVSRYCLDVLNGQIEFGDINKMRIVLIPKVLHSLKMKKRGKKGHFAIKLDMSKAYDRVEWDFLAGMIRALGFHVDWIVFIMRCVSSVTYSVCLNGEDIECFSPSRGLRQGDPFSPYLFLICAEGFSTLLEDAKQRGYDCILFGDATHEGATTVRAIIQEYEMCAGQKVNYDKSLVYFGANVNEGTKDEITNLLGVRMATNPEKYLGLPMMVGRRKTWAFADFIDRFRKRAAEWNFRFLSMRGKEGERVNIWHDPWLPGKENNRVLDHEIVPPWTHVNQLIDVDSNTWNRELIYNIVDDNTADRILSIPIANCRTEDTLESACPLCRAELEDSSHLMWSCGVLKSVWTHLQVQIPDIKES